MAKFWRAALAVAGLGAIGAFVFWSLYSKWVSLGIFSNLSSEQTFILMLVFLGLTFLALIAALITYANLQKGGSNLEINAGTYSIPPNWTFKTSAEKLAGRRIVEFVGFYQRELLAPVQAKEFEASTDIAALAQLRLLTNGKVRPYTTQVDLQGKIVLRIS